MAKKATPSPTAATPATRLLQQHSTPFQLHHTEVPSEDYGHDAAAELHRLLGVEAERVFKTLLVDLHAGKGPRPELAVGIVPVTGSLDLKALAHALGVPKVAMATKDDAERVSGYVRGGMSPIGMKKLLPTVIDELALVAETIFVSGGRRGSEIEIAPQDLATVLSAEFAPIGRD